MDGFGLPVVLRLHIHTNKSLCMCELISKSCEYLEMESGAWDAIFPWGPECLTYSTFESLSYNALSRLNII